MPKDGYYHVVYRVIPCEYGWFLEDGKRCCGYTKRGIRPTAAIEQFGSGTCTACRLGIVTRALNTCLKDWSKEIAQELLEVHEKWKTSYAEKIAKIILIPLNGVDENKTKEGRIFEQWVDEQRLQPATGVHVVEFPGVFDHAESLRGVVKEDLS